MNKEHRPKMPEAEAHIESITQPDVFVIVNFLLNSPPGTTLEAIDSGTGKHVRLDVGVGQCLQAVDGTDRYAVAAHPGRFRLTPASNALCEAALAETQRLISRGIRDEALVAAIQAIEETEYEGIQQLEKLLKDIIASRGIDLLSQDMACLVAGRKSGNLALALKLATTIGDPQREYSLNRFGKNPTYCPGFAGDKTAQFLKKILAGFSEVVRSLEKSDTYTKGPYAIIFDLLGGRILILNRVKAIQCLKPQK